MKNSVIIQGIDFLPYFRLISTNSNWSSDEDIRVTSQQLQQLQQKASELDFQKLTKKDRELLGFGTWNKETTPASLIPSWIWNALPKGLPIESIMGEKALTGDDINLDIRFGYIVWRLCIWDKK